MRERKVGGFAHLLEALCYAAEVPSQRLSWFDSTGQLADTLTYAQLLQRTEHFAQALTQRTAHAEINSNAIAQRIGIIAHTGPDFLALFCACQWIGAIPCPLPVLGVLQDAERYTQSLQNMCVAAGISTVLVPPSLKKVLQTPALAGIACISFDELACSTSGTRMPTPTVAPILPDAIAYVQFSSGSTGQPKGVAISHAALMHNVDAILQHGMKLTEDDCAFSWLPYFHDMGLVGFVLAPLCGQVSVDYLAPAAFARRPYLWLNLMAERGSTITYAPNFAWRLAAQCAEKVSPERQLHAIRIAGIGGDYVDYGALVAFKEVFEKHGFDANAFKPSYGLAEATLAVTMCHAPFIQQCAYFSLDEVSHQVKEVLPDTPDAKPLVNCGLPLTDWTIHILDDAGQPLPPGVEGAINLQGSAQLSGYFKNGHLEHTVAAQPISTGDRGFLSTDGALYITGRSKDMIVINGRNIWPLDVELAVHEQTLIALEHMQLIQVHASNNHTPQLHLLVHEKALRQHGGSGILNAIETTATATAGAKVIASLVPNGMIAYTSSGKKARALTASRFTAQSEIPLSIPEQADGLPTNFSQTKTTP
ncbi:hypothetical protein E9531_08060 [Lampropedia puyangensis]|uniref:AMP-dependent synthetase/ligase domain-containing protein n=1 Tax=Lampropedia puyangensis TaxID=1330072 RepID=A0A4S8F4A5_9BURK|nr:AMP-binding protein [Lampropedia puyangensis]THU01947.1 hypothetical protein E9531_08060 [Lampropedia puyangensis]